MTDDDPIDLVQVGADDAALEGVRAGRVADDLVLLLLRDLLEDVGQEEVPVPVGCGSTVLALAGDRTPERRTARNGALVVALAAGLLSVSGVAAASTLVPSGTPLHGLGEAVRSAVSLAVGAVTPPDPVTPAPEPAPLAPAAPPAPARTGTATAPAGADVSAAARSAAAARQVTALLDAADALLREGRTDVASVRLDTAERRLADVLPADAGPLAERLAGLRDQVQAASAPAPARKPAAPKEQAPRDTAPQADRPEAKAPKEQPRSDRQPAGKGPSARGSARTQPPSAPQPDEDRGQPSSDASTKPRA